MLRRLCLRPLQQRTFLTSGRRRRRRLVGILMPPPRAGSGEKTTLTTSTTTTTSRKRRRRRKEEESEINDRQKWRSLEAGKDDLSLDRTLPTGQSFRWQKVRDDDDEGTWEKCRYATYVGVIGRRVVKIRERVDEDAAVEEEEKNRGNIGPKKSTIEFRILNEEADDETSAENATKDMRAYFNLDDPIPLKDLFEQFSKADPRRFGALRKYVRGARTLRQPPAECLISFVCSSNNNIARIKKMVESLCEKYGEELVCNASSDYDGATDDEKEESEDN